jgi:F-type H+-transporting ATPase subunit a
LTGDNISSRLFNTGECFVLLIIGVIFYLQYKKPEKKLVPSPKISFTGIIEIISEALYSLTKSVVGRDSDKFYPLVGSVFFYILVSNLIGLIPGFISPTDNINTNAIRSNTCLCLLQLYRNKNTWLIKYLKHFAGPITGSLHYFCNRNHKAFYQDGFTIFKVALENIVGDHMVLSIFFGSHPMDYTDTVLFFRNSCPAYFKRLSLHFYQLHILL